MPRPIALILLFVAAALSSCGGSSGDEAPQAPVEVSLSGNLGTLRQGDALELTWRAQSAQACTASGAWSGAKALSGTQSVTVDSFGAVTFTLACTSGSSSATSSVTVSVEQTVATSNVQPTTETQTSLPNVATVTVAPATFAASTQSEVRRTDTGSSLLLFQEIAPLFSAANPNTYQVKIRFGSTRPERVVRARVVLPSEFRSQLGAQGEARLFYLLETTTESETLRSFEPLPQRGLADTEFLDVELAPYAFYLAADGNYEATVLLAQTPTRSATTSSTGTKSALAASSSTFRCEGYSINRPVDSSFVVSSSFGVRVDPVSGVESSFHSGTDFDVPIGTDVLAAADGTIVYADHGSEAGGAGFFVVVRHNAGGATRYLHLTPDSSLPVGSDVRAGDVIAKSGNTGRSTGPHLHFEFSPSGREFAFDGRIDPEPCFGRIATGSFTISDNGSLADDAFEVSLNGRLLCTTAIGASNNCAIGTLRSGDHSLEVHALIAPDNIGTYEIVVTTLGMLVDGTSSVEGRIPRGARATHTLTVE